MAPTRTPFSTTPQPDAQGTGSLTKGPNAFRTISEAADEIGVPQHVLRFWETKFSFIRPMKRAGGRRFYRPQDIVVLQGVKTLLYDQGYKIEGVQKLHREHGLKRVAIAGGADLVEDALVEDPLIDDGDEATGHGDQAAPLGDDARLRLRRALADLEAAKARLDDLLPG
jgi:DNA-binding transcriptional MerR regulator